MTYTALVLAYAASVWIAFRIQLRSMRELGPITNGGAIFCGFVAAVPIAGLVAALIVAVVFALTRSGSRTDRECRWFNDRPRQR